MNRLLSSLVPLSLALAAGCGLDLVALTAPPPGAVANLDDDCLEIELSRGAALAVGCSDPQGELCEEMIVEVADPEIADARIAYRNELEYTYAGPQPATSFVVYGKSAGETEIFVDAAGGSETYFVRVLAP